MHDQSVTVCIIGGGERVRTDDLLRARQALSQLSYTPSSRILTTKKRHPQLVGLGRFELPTSRLSGVRSNRLSYRPFLEVIRRQHRSLPDRLLEINSGNNDLRVLTWDVSLFGAKALHLKLTP